MLTDKQLNDANAYGEWLRLATLSVLGVLSLADDAETSEKLLERFKTRMRE